MFGMSPGMKQLLCKGIQTVPGKIRKRRTLNPTVTLTKGITIV